MSALPARPLDADPVARAAGPIGRVRWTICGLLFAASTINYIDRQVLGLLAPDLQRTIGWDELQYGYIVSAFQAAYALGSSLPASSWIAWGPAGAMPLP
jgi:Sugar phosphate permease